MYTYETRRMEDVAELVACLVGVNTGPSPGATGLRGVIGGGGGGRVALDVVGGGVGKLGPAGPLDGVRPSPPGGGTTDGVAGEPLGGVRATVG